MKIVRTRHPPEEYLSQILSLFLRGGVQHDHREVSERLRGLPTDDRLLFALEGDRVLGFAHVHANRDLWQPESAEVASLFVDPEARRRGVGSRLVAAAEAWALEAGRARLLLRTEVGRSDLHAFCLAIGYDQGATSIAFSRDLEKVRRSESPTQQR